MEYFLIYKVFQSLNYRIVVTVNLAFKISIVNYYLLPNHFLRINL